MDDLLWRIINIKDEWEKTRFEFACMPDGSVWGLRSHQGHSTSAPAMDELSLTPITALDVDTIYHATYESNVESIIANGLLCGGTQSEGRKQLCFTIMSANDSRAKDEAVVMQTRGGDPFLMVHYGAIRRNVEVELDMCELMHYRIPIGQQRHHGAVISTMKWIPWHFIRRI